jgi:hypothetical protein
MAGMEKDGLKKEINELVEINNHENYQEPL